MSAYHEWVSPTRIAGLTAYAASFTACTVRCMSCRKSRVSRRWFALLSGVQFLLLLDIAFDWRWKIHELGIRAATAHGVYDLRSLPQMLALAVLSAAVVFPLVLIWSRFNGRAGLALALTGTVLSVGIWCCEVISFHSVDRVLYSMIGNVMVVGLLWICFAAATCFGVGLDGWRAVSKQQNRL